MAGGSGDDLYLVDDLGDIVTELAAGGYDEVRTSVSGYQIPAHVERLIDTVTGALQFRGSAVDDSYSGSAVADLFFLDQGGGDHANGGSGDDGFFFGAAFGVGDRIEGGADNDQIGLQGNYTFTFAGTSFTGVETLALLSGSDAEFGDTGGNRYDYAFTSHDANVAAGQNLIVNANGLLAGEDLFFNGSPEGDGTFTFFGGFGANTLIGGTGSDGFFFGEGRFGANEYIDGNAGADDQLGLRGDYSTLLVFTASMMRNIDTIAVISATDLQYGAPGQAFSYSLKTHDDNLAGGAQLTVTANGLAVNEVLTFDGSSETDGVFRLIGGAGADVMTGGALGDTLFGGNGANVLTGRGGADLLIGGAANDRFVYLAATDSTAAARDTIQGFASGDKIDLSGIDAIAGGADTAFTYIGSNAFSGAGQVRRVGVSGGVEYQADLDGDFNADLVIFVQGAGGYVPGGADLIL